MENWAKEKSWTKSDEHEEEKAIKFPRIFCEADSAEYWLQVNFCVHFYIAINVEIFCCAHES